MIRSSQVILWSDRSPKPWKNGGGSTTEIAVWPIGAGFDDFEWRLSVADVASDGPFSEFAGMDRTLVLIHGRGVELEIDGTRKTLTEGLRIAGFPGDSRTAGHLLGGPIRDLNVMTRRGVWRHSVSFVAPGNFRSDAPMWFLFCPAPDGAAVTVDGEHFALRTYDTLAAEGTTGQAETSTDCYLLELWPIDSACLSLDTYV